jgi:pimeloyl-ACP methyl ester carboxylesterase
MQSTIRQTVRYVTASTVCASHGPNRARDCRWVKAANWLTHLEYDLQSPVWRHWMTLLTDHFRCVRYDERGCGMSEWTDRDLSLDRRALDLETVIGAAQLTQPVFLLGISQGAAICIAFAVNWHPDCLPDC